MELYKKWRKILTEFGKRLNLVSIITNRLNEYNNNNILQKLYRYSYLCNYKINEKTVCRIARTKLNFFGKKDWKRCPCDESNPLRYCGSKLCRQDIETKGKCHCNLFLRK